MLFSTSAMGDPVESTLELIRSPAYKVRVRSALILGKIGRDSGRAVDALLKAVGDRHRAVRAAAAMALGKLGDPSALEVLSNAVGDDDMRVSSAARKAVTSVVKHFVKRRGRFSENRYSFTIGGLGSSQSREREVQLKDAVMEGLIAHENIDVGSTHVDYSQSKQDKTPGVLLDLSGQIVGVSTKKCTLALTLALRPGGHVVKRWKSIVARGKSEDDAVVKAAKIGTKRVLKFLGAH
jgi:hypothetical protein